MFRVKPRLRFQLVLAGGFGSRISKSVLSRHQRSCFSSFGINSEGGNEEKDNQNLIANMQKLHITAVDKQVSPSSVDISAYLGDKQWNRPKTSSIEKDQLLEILSLSETSTSEQLLEKFSGDENVNLNKEDIEALIRHYGVPEVELADEKLF